MKITNKKSYYFNIFLVTVAITIPHSILTIILLGKGITLSQIAFIQSMYSLAIILFEFPSGVLSDLTSRKKIYLLSLLFQIIGFSFILYFSNFYLLCAAWFLYGISTALDSGTLDSEILVELKSKNEDIMDFMKNSEQLRLVSAIIGAGSGFYLYNKIDINIYYVSLGFLLTSLIWVYTTFKSDKSEKKRETGIKKHIKELLLEIREKPQIKYLIVGKGIFQIFVQVHFQFWQGIFLYKNISKEYFYLFYLVFQFVTIFSYKTNIKKVDIKKMLFLYGVCLVTILSLKTEAINNVVFLTMYFAIVFMMFIVSYIYDYWFNIVIDIDRISSLTSLMSTISRVFSFATLLILGIELKYFSIINIFIINTVLSLTLVLIIFIKLYLNYSKVKK